MEEAHKELQLLPTSHSTPSSSRIPSWPSDSSLRFRSSTGSEPSLDLQLSISLRPIRPPSSDCVIVRPNICDYTSGTVRPDMGCVEALKWQAAEQIRLAAMEKAYAESVRELTKREMEMAQSEFARARHLWERARDEVEKVERMKERATRQVDSTCMEITCQSCRQTFRP
ncbi:protein indeterminate-domain 16 [Cornus florida]|uniref:protein indeterminate-domain 16 n=1 Tax=Cornus florida TaxID=4283 RepID=UPI0028A1770F|nr:protein indeterminate-domain 16 [Cornus florida]